MTAPTVKREPRRPRPLITQLVAAAADWRTPLELATAVGRTGIGEARSVEECLRQYHRRGLFARRRNASEAFGKWQYRDAAVRDGGSV